MKKIRKMFFVGDSYLWRFRTVNMSFSPEDLLGALGVKKNFIIVTNYKPAIYYLELVPVEIFAGMYSIVNTNKKITLCSAELLRYFGERRPKNLYIS